MGARGPIPISQAAAEARGNPGRRKRNPSAAETTAVGIPRKPAHLTGAAATEWKRVTRELAAQGRIAETDRAVLAAYCSAWARWVEADKALGDDYTALGSTGQRVKSPEFLVWSELGQRVLAASQALGLHVAARMRLPGTAAGGDEDAFDALIRGRDR